jgi:hypothetical protein
MTIIKYDVIFEVEKLFNYDINNSKSPFKAQLKIEEKEGNGVVMG